MLSKFTRVCQGAPGRRRGPEDREVRHGEAPAPLHAAGREGVACVGHRPGPRGGWAADSQFREM